MCDHLPRFQQPFLERVKDLLHALYDYHPTWRQDDGKLIRSPTPLKIVLNLVSVDKRESASRAFVLRNFGTFKVNRVSVSEIKLMRAFVRRFRCESVVATIKNFQDLSLRLFEGVTAVSYTHLTLPTTPYV